MYLFRFQGDDGLRLGMQDRGGWRLDLTAAVPEVFSSVSNWLAQPDPVAALRGAAGQAAIGRVENRFVSDDVPLLAPLDTQEVWAAGVTYERSKVARMEESAGGGDFYDKVYEAERPELFLKAAGGHRVVGPGQEIRVRRDSHWNVPEPEMTLVLSSAGKIVGVTVGNDVSSRDIEGENPLYLPQAKVYNGACALGPMIRIVDDELDLRNLPIRLAITRDGETAFSGETSTARMKRTPEELAAYLFRELTFPSGAFLMTGTGVVPPDDFSLQGGDIVSIHIEGVGTLTNPVAAEPPPIAADQQR
jgi:2-dehydro-3-deoxy-D-arabinonate dehydratase